MSGRPPVRTPRKTRGQGLAEYGLILGLIAVICLASLSATGGGVQGLLEKCVTAASSNGSGQNGCPGLTCPADRACLASSAGAACCWGSTAPHCHTPCS